ncbi:hypothetical protein CKM354_000420600 [Cercospora kikuchii]|uniref:RING-type domain-containing protein n=1 Tax=Cercospora kikuchii TaxID=84275 RepID=A0A9P3CJE9_9PEZI|nr:uncharacterized protein CKM354_000420600 [Cercospora kikuchii]GIZ40885.1 hypothetical protein CKM354_000420600 [Cercospora kikuchii]
MAPPSHPTSAGPDTPLYSHSSADLRETYGPSFSTTDDRQQKRPGPSLNTYDSSASNGTKSAVDFGMNASNSSHDSLRPPALNEIPSYHYGIQPQQGNIPMTANNQYGNMHNPTAHQGQQDHFHGRHYQSSVPPATHQHMHQPQWQTSLGEPALHSMDESRRNMYAEFDRQASEAVPRFAPSYHQPNPTQMGSYNTRPTWYHLPTGSAMPPQQHNAVNGISNGQSLQMPQNVAAILQQQLDASNAWSYYQTFPVNENNTANSSATARPNSQHLSIEFDYWRPPQASALRSNTSVGGASRVNAAALPSKDTFLANHLRVVKRPSEEECPICFHRFHNAVTLPCDHVFCKDCIKRWFRRSNTCPFDRQKLFRWPAQRVRTAQGNIGQGHMGHE